MVNGCWMNPQPRLPDCVRDEILTVDGEPTMIWQQVTLQLLARLGETGAVNLTVASPETGRVRRYRSLSGTGWVAKLSPIRLPTSASVSLKSRL